MSGTENQDMAAVGSEILFTKVARKGQFGHAADRNAEKATVSDVGQSRSKPGGVRVQLSQAAVNSIETNVKRYKEFLQ